VTAEADIGSVPEPLSPDAFAEACDVSRETLARLQIYVDLLRDWQTRKNLVGKATLDDVWRRHMLDSAQLLPLIDPDAEVVDLGSGAGFPGLVLAVLGVQNVRLVESDQRKCAFLREAAAATGTSVEIYPERVEVLGRSTLKGIADVVTARALAPLPKLLGWAAPLLAPDGQCLFLKGARAAEELTEARKDWTMRLTQFPSRSDPSGTVLKLEYLRRAAHRPQSHRHESERRPSPQPRPRQRKAEFGHAQEDRTPVQDKAPDRRDHQPERRRRQDHDGGQPRRGAGRRRP
jgi:16S rRNA (guanine527-N7)-methyltransferase